MAGCGGQCERACELRLAVSVDDNLFLFKRDTFGEGGIRAGGLQENAADCPISVLVQSNGQLGRRGCVEPRPHRILGFGDWEKTPHHAGFVVGKKQDVVPAVHNESVDRDAVVRCQAVVPVPLLMGAWIGRGLHLGSQQLPAET